jgi:hypothetical protein
MSNTCQRKTLILIEDIQAQVSDFVDAINSSGCTDVPAMILATTALSFLFESDSVGEALEKLRRWFHLSELLTGRSLIDETLFELIKAFVKQTDDWLDANDISHEQNIFTILKVGRTCAYFEFDPARLGNHRLQPLPV